MNYLAPLAGTKISHQTLPIINGGPPFDFTEKLNNILLDLRRWNPWGPMATRILWSSI